MFDSQNENKKNIGKSAPPRVHLIMQHEKKFILLLEDYGIWEILLSRLQGRPRSENEKVEYLSDLLKWNKSLYNKKKCLVSSKWS